MIWPTGGQVFPTGLSGDSSSGGSGGTRPVAKNFISWTPSHPVGLTYTYFSRPPAQNLSKLIDGYGGSVGASTSGTDGLLVAGSSVEIIATFSASAYINEIAYSSGQYNSSDSNAPTSLVISYGLTSLKTISLSSSSNVQLFDLLADTAFNQAFPSLKLVFTNNGLYISIMELGFRGVTV